MSKKRLFLIDGNSFCYRAYYAIRPLTNSKGQPTNAVYGFVTMLNKLIKDNAPDMLAVAFDLKGPTFRHEKYEEYKIHRKPMPDELVSQMPIIKEVVAAHNIPIYEMQGYEADDILATVAKKAEERDIDTFIVTGDKDALQLVNQHIKVCNPQKDNIIIDSAKVKELFGVGPDRIPDLMALMGDATDNIPGVPGIGEKTAIELMAEFGSLENLLKHVDKVKGESRKNKLRENEKLAVMSKELAVLDAAVPIKIDFKEMELKEPDGPRLLELFKELEFKSMVKEFTPKGKLDSTYELIDDDKGLKKLLAQLEEVKEFAFDFETTAEDPMLADPVGVSFSWRKGHAHYVPLNKYHDCSETLEAMRPIFEDRKSLKIGQNIKYEYIILANRGIMLGGKLFDTMVASYLLNPSKLNHNLEDISIEFLNHRMTTPIEELIGKGKSAITMDKVDVQKVSDYCCEDSDVTFRLKGILAGQMEERGLSELFSEVEMPLTRVLAGMEIEGVSIDRDYLGELSKEMERKLEKLTKKIYELAGEEFNINSPKQLSAILFEKLKLPIIKKTKTGISTDEDVLRKLAPKHKLPHALIEYRELSKLKSTYVDSLPELINPKTGRIHTSFNQTVTATGRLSSSEPNLQNIPIKTEEGRRIRKAFVPSSGKNVLLSADYSQIELRVLAHLSGDKHLQKAFRDGSDIHSFTASLVANVDEKDVTPEMRSMAKTVNFGIVYGMSPYGLSQSLGIEVDKAKEFIDSYFSRYPDVKKYLEAMVAEARDKGCVTTILGRRRYIPEINSPDMRLRQFAERMAINTPIQGSAADIIKIAMIRISETLAREKLATRMTLQVHDELVFDVPKTELAAAYRLVKDGMENVIKLHVPVEAHIEVGKNWLEMDSYGQDGSKS
jgi:DNA polymerase-1